MRVGAVVLAAGASSRLGAPKQLAQVGGETLLERAVRVASEAGCAPVVIVLGARADEIAAACGLGALPLMRAKTEADPCGMTNKGEEPLLGKVACEAKATTKADVCGMTNKWVRNEDWAEGMASSIRAGIAALAGQVDAAVVMACDQPAVTAHHLQALMAGGVLASAYAGRRGIPACFPADVFGELMRLRGDQGARDLLQTARAVDLPGGELDVDTVEALAAAEARFGQAKD